MLGEKNVPKWILLSFWYERGIHICFDTISIRGIHKLRYLIFQIFCTNFWKIRKITKFLSLFSYTRWFHLWIYPFWFRYPVGPYEILVLDQIQEKIDLSPIDGTLQFKDSSKLYGIVKAILLPPEDFHPYFAHDFGTSEKPDRLCHKYKHSKNL